MNGNGHKRRGLEFGGFRLYPEERLLEKDDLRVPLTPRVLDLLIVLVGRGGELVSKEELLSAIWADSFVEEGNINRTVSTLRKSLGSQANGSDFIETVPKSGYRFIAPVEEYFENGVEEHAKYKPPSINTFKYVAAGGMLLLIILAASSIYYYSGTASAVAKDGMTNLTNNLAEDDFAAISPDGKRIAFTSNRDGNSNIYSMNMDGSSVTRLTNTQAEDRSPTWSPDGTKILFESKRDGNLEIYIMNTDGSGQTRLTYNPTIDGGPAQFSPDGTQIAFARSAAKDGTAYYNFDIYMMNADGSGQKQLTTDAEYDAGPNWSPDGTRIAFVSGREKGFDVFVMNADGSGQINLTADAEEAVPMGWTPDGKQIIYNGETSDKAEIFQVWIMNADGTDRRQITSFTDKTYRVTYSPMAKKFAFSSKKDGNFEIYLTDGNLPDN